MFRYRLRQASDGIRRLLRVTTLAEHEAVQGEFESLRSRLDAIVELIRSESAARAEQDRQLASEVEGQLRQLAQLGQLAQLNDLEERLGEKVSTIARSNQDPELIRGLKEFLSSYQQLGVDRWKLREYEGLIRYFRRQDYFRAIREGRLEVPRLETQHPLAISSNDTRFPRGSKNDNSILPRFNRKLYQYLGDRPRLRVLDLGCAGGGLVRSVIDDGNFAVGLDGSDYPILNQTGEWGTIPLHLFTCDITKPFRLIDQGSGEPLLFDAVTAWEVMEHIPENDLPGLFDNLDRHLAPGGCLLFSIATFLDWDERTGTIWHSTVKPREWWHERFAKLGFRVEDRHPFGKEDWVRGSGHCRGDWHEDEGLGFHVLLRRTADSGAAAEGGSSWRAAVA